MTSLNHDFNISSSCLSGNNHAADWPRIAPASYTHARSISPVEMSCSMFTDSRERFYALCAITRAGTNTPSDEYDTYREYRVANTNMYSRIHFFSEAKLGNGLSVLVYACTMYSAQKFHFANLVYYRYCLFDIQVCNYSSTCHERTPSGPGKSVRTLQVAARHRDGWAGGVRQM